MPFRPSVSLSNSRAWWICVVIGLLVYGMPAAVGSTWFLTPGFPSRTDGTRRPAYLMGYDSFSFPQFDLPYRELVRDSLRQGEIPLWNPYSSLGVPVVAQYQNQVFSPFEWIDLLIYRNWWWNITYVLRVALAGFGAFLVGRLLWRDDLVAIIGGALYMLSAYFAGFQSIGAFINGAVTLPWIFLAIGWAFAGRPFLPSTGLVGIVFGLAATSGQPQIALINFGGAALLCGISLQAASNPARWRGLLILGLGTVLAGALAAPQLAAFWEGLNHSHTLHGSGAYAHGGTTRLNLLTPFLPMLLGPMMSPWLPSLFPSTLNHEGFPIMLGTGLTLAFFLGLIGALSGKIITDRSQRVHLVWILGLILTFVGIVVSGSLGWAQLWSHPVLSRINLARYGTPLASLLIVQVAAVGLVHANRIPRWALLMGLGLVVTLVGILHVEAWPALTAPAESTNAPLRRASIVIAELSGGVTLIGVIVILFLRSREAPASTAVGCTILILAEQMLSIRYGFDLRSEYWRLASWALLVAASFAWAWNRWRQAISAGAAAFAGLFWLSWSAPNFLEKARDPYHETSPHLSLLKESLGPGSARGRVLTSKWVMTPNTLIAFGVNQLASLNPLQPTLTANWFIATLTTKTVHASLPVGWQGMVNESEWPDWNDYAENRLIYNFMGVRFLAETSARELTALALPDLKLVLDHPSGRIYEDTRALPRAFLAYGNIVSTRTNAEALARAVQHRNQPNFPELSVTIPQEQLSGFGDKAAGVRIEPVAEFVQRSNDAQVVAAPSQPALLVVTDVWYPGWHAWVNGRETPIWPVQGVMRGVFLPAGPSTVEFRYQPSWLKPSLWLMTLGWTITLGFISLSLRRPGEGSHRSEAATVVS